MILPFIKTYKKIATLFILLVIFFIYFLNKYNNILDKKNLDIFVSNQIQIIENELENQKNQALSLALMFSRNQEIIKSLENKNNIELKKELLKLLNIIETYTKNSIDVQIHTKDLEVFTRSWEDKDFGLKLDSFREGLVKVKNQKEPYVSSELGKRFNIKAIVPIYNDKNIFIGSLEVIVDFKSLVNRLKTLGIDSIVMLEKDYLKIATYHQNNQKFKDYAILESSFTKGLLDILEKNPQFLKKDKFYYELDNRIFTQIPLGEFENSSVGVLLISFDKNINNFRYLPKYDYFIDVEIKDEKNDNKDILKKEIIIR
ncbi:cache domain-containing protein [Aliarcobacter cryaerophilus]|uniref:cache domain-containing protein n=1 Tax=Aliarcobacter cryaerophilus TaxID=28198 RepID=UPI00112F0927|nr:cache domain-containing protein [Aliarcobacter cryaerophilus]